MGMSCIALISPRSGIIISTRPETGSHTRVCCLIAGLPVLTHQKKRARKSGVCKDLFVFSRRSLANMRLLSQMPARVSSSPEALHHDQLFESQYPLLRILSSLTSNTEDWGTAGRVFATPFKTFPGHVTRSGRIFDHLLDGRSKRI